jgi:hypothetical protein
MAETISQEMGAPLSLSRAAQVPAGLRHLKEIVKVLEHFEFEELKGHDTHAQRTHRSLWTHHSLELAHESDCLQSCARLLPQDALWC